VQVHIKGDDPDGVSCVEPGMYKQRFQDWMRDIIVPSTAAKGIFRNSARNISSL
jgi:hypothetical protein